MERLLKMAWRNIWRNRRRTVITSASIFFAVFFAIIMRSMQLGSYSHMITQSIEKYSGYLQIQSPDYFDNPSLDNFMEYTDGLKKLIAQTPEIKVAVPRIESFVLASTGHQSKGVMVTGIDPVAERRVSNPEHMLINFRLTPEIVKKVLAETTFSKKQKDLLISNENGLYHDLDRLAIDLSIKPEKFGPYREVFKKYAKYGGRYLEPDDDGILLSSKLAKYLRADVGDTVVLMGQGKYGSTAAGLYPVRGIVKVPSPDLDNKLVYMTLSSAENLFDMQGLITTLAMNLTNTDMMFDIQDRLNSEIDKEKFVVKNWQQLNPTLKQQIEGDNKSGQMFVGILYFIVFFGIFGTVMMMIAERKREFGVMVAIGMRKQKMAFVVVLEMVFIGLVGTVSGMLASLPIIIGFNRNPIRFMGEMAKMYEDMGFDPVMPTATVDRYFMVQGLIVFAMVLIACYIPLKKIRKMKIMDALRA